MKHRIAEIQEAKGVSTRAMARKMGRDPAQVSRIIRGENKLTLEFLLLFSAALDVTPSEIVGVDLGGKPVPVSAKCDQALMGAVISYIYEACESFGITATPDDLSSWIASVYDHAIKRELNLSQIREFAFCVVKIDPRVVNVEEACEIAEVVPMTTTSKKQKRA